MSRESNMRALDEKQKRVVGSGKAKIVPVIDTKLGNKSVIIGNVYEKHARSK